VALDRSDDQDPDGAADNDPDKPDDQSAREPDRPGEPLLPAETRSRADYYDALRIAVREHSSWYEVDEADRPPLDDIAVLPERATHILEGDETGGGHRHGASRPGKTEFPADWDDIRIISSIVDVARTPDRTPIYQNWNGRWLVRGTRDEVEIVVVVTQEGSIWSGWPRPGGPGVVKNPEAALWTSTR
jgi:hypothetical protein